MKPPRLFSAMNRPMSTVTTVSAGARAIGLMKTRYIKPPPTNDATTLSSMAGTSGTPQASSCHAK